MWKLSVTTACAALASWPVATFGCGTDGQVRPLGSDHLLYTIERAAAADAPSLKGRKFRLIVDEPEATGFTILPEGAFQVTELSRFEGNVTYTAEIVDVQALYKSESWGRLPRPLEFRVACAPGGGAPAADLQQAARPAPRPALPTPPSTTSPPAKMVTLTPSALRTELAATSEGIQVEAYPQAQLQSEPLPPVPVPAPEPESSAAPQPARVETRVAAAQQRLGEPAGNLSPSELAQLEIKLDSRGEEAADAGKARLRYELVLRNPLARDIQCDIEVESYYPRSFGSSEFVRIDLQTHEGIQIRSRGFRTGVTGEIHYMPNVLGGTRWMQQNRYAPEKGGLRLRNCVALKG